MPCWQCTNSACVWIAVCVLELEVVIAVRSKWNRHACVVQIYYNNDGGSAVHICWMHGITALHWLWTGSTCVCVAAHMFGCQTIIGVTWECNAQVPSNHTTIATVALRQSLFVARMKQRCHVGYGRTARALYCCVYMLELEGVIVVRRECNAHVPSKYTSMAMMVLRWRLLIQRWRANPWQTARTFIWVWACAWICAVPDDSFKFDLHLFSKYITIVTAVPRW